MTPPPETPDPLFRPWGDISLEDGEERTIRLGPLTLDLRRVGSELWLRHVEPPGPTMGAREPGGGEPEWSRWALPGDEFRLRLTPVLPDRAVVVAPERTFHLVRGAEARLYVRVPLRVRIRIAGEAGVTLTEAPTVTLSDTWFGDFTEGELCYALPTTGRQEMTPDLFAPHLAVCTLRLMNRAVDQLEVERLCLRVAHLSLFAREGEIWSDETRVSFRSHVEGSDVRMTGKPPPPAPDALLVEHPRAPLGKGFRVRTFSRLANFPGIGS